MKKPSVITNMAAVIAGRENPSITRWNRLEGRPRTHDFERAMRAEVRDALWMISRQWQMGEFQGDDAGSPILARACVDTMSINRFQAGSGLIETFGIAEPLEAKAERLPLPLRADKQYMSLDLRLLVGRRWLKLLETNAKTSKLSKDYRASYIHQYGVKLPDHNTEADAMICAHSEAWQQVSAVAERAMDGIALLEYLLTSGNHAYDNISAKSGDKIKLDDLAMKLQNWFQELILQPPALRNDAWLPERLEYQFNVSAQGRGIEQSRGIETVVLHAEEYYQGNLDWYALEQHKQQTKIYNTRAQTTSAPTAIERDVRTFLPSTVVFEGMPSTRWWAFEDRHTNFGDIKPDTTDLGKLLFMEFGLNYANDWLIIPYTLPIGHIAKARGIAITNVFNERFWIEPLSDKDRDGWEKWGLFALCTESDKSNQQPAQLVLLPTAPDVKESASIEEISLIRDEIANMVWGIEQRIPLPSGMSKSGAEAAKEYLVFLQKLLDENIKLLMERKSILEAIPATKLNKGNKKELAEINEKLKEAPSPNSDIRYQVMNTVPEYWIPFIPVHVDGSVREIQLQRASLPRILKGDPTSLDRVFPRTTLLQQNLHKAYFIFEEEVPRAGTVVSQTYQRTRWIGGKIFTWLGIRKQTGRGEGSSGLRFDSLIDTKK